MMPDLPLSAQVKGALQGQDDSPALSSSLIYPFCPMFIATLWGIIPAKASFACEGERLDSSGFFHVVQLRWQRRRDEESDSRGHGAALKDAL